METATTEETNRVQSTNTEEDENEKLKKEELAILEEYFNELTQRREWKSSLRKCNLNVENRPEECDLHKLDSSLKKNTAFVRKIKNFTEAQKDAILKEMTSLNLTKYIGEVASGIVEAKLKMNDLPGIIEISSKLHQRYAEFAPSLLTAWQKALGFKKDEKIANSSKLRVDLRFYSDLISVGVFSLKDSLSTLGSVLTNLVAMDKEDHSHIAIILTFCKHCGDEYAGLVPRKVRLIAEKSGRKIPAATLLSPDKQKNVRQMLKDYFTTVCKHLVSEHAEMLSVERTNRRIMMTKGEVHVERRERAESLQNAFSKLFLNAEMMADVLDEDMPELKKELAFISFCTGCLNVPLDLLLLGGALFKQSCGLLPWIVVTLLEHIIVGVPLIIFFGLISLYLAAQLQLYVVGTALILTTITVFVLSLSSWFTVLSCYNLFKQQSASVEPYCYDEDQESDGCCGVRSSRPSDDSAVSQQSRRPLLPNGTSHSSSRPRSIGGMPNMPPGHPAASSRRYCGSQATRSNTSSSSRQLPPIPT